MSEDFYQEESSVRAIGSRFAMVPQWVFNAVDARALQCYTALMFYVSWQGEERKAWPSKKRLAEDTRTSESTIDRAMKDLCDAGALIIEKRFREDGGQASNNYWLITQEADRGIPLEYLVAMDEKGGYRERPVPPGQPRTLPPGQPCTPKNNNKKEREVTRTTYMPRVQTPLKQQRTIATQEWIDSLREEWVPKLQGHWRTFEDVIEWSTNRKYFDSTKDQQKYILGRLSSAFKEKQSTRNGRGSPGPESFSATSHNGGQPVPQSLPTFEEERREKMRQFAQRRAEGKV